MQKNIFACETLSPYTAARLSPILTDVPREADLKSSICSFEKNFSLFERAITLKGMIHRQQPRILDFDPFLHAPQKYILAHVLRSDMAPDNAL